MTAVTSTDSSGQRLIGNLPASTSGDTCSITTRRCNSGDKGARLAALFRRSDREAILFWFVGSQQRGGTRLQLVTDAPAHRARRRFQLGRIDHTLPLLAAFERRKREQKSLMMGVQEQQKRIPDNSITLFVHFVDYIAGQTDPQAFGKSGAPGLVGHFLSVGIEKGDVFH